MAIRPIKGGMESRKIDPYIIKEEGEGERKCG